jgi:hypothetical protein
MPVTYVGQTYRDRELVDRSFVEATFDNCAFHGEIIRCSFVNATFNPNCTFDDNLKLTECILGGAEGLPEKFECPPRREIFPLRFDPKNPGPRPPLR